MYNYYNNNFISAQYICDIHDMCNNYYNYICMYILVITIKFYTKNILRAPSNWRRNNRCAGCWSSQS